MCLATSGKLFRPGQKLAIIIHPHLKLYLACSRTARPLPLSAAPSMSRFPTAPFSPEQGRGGCDIRVIRGSQKKSRALDHAWLSCQSVSGPPFGGITRIRFKGSAPKQFGALSATRLPRTFFLAQNKTHPSEVN